MIGSEHDRKQKRKATMEISVKSEGVGIRAGGFSSLVAIPSYLVHWLRRAAVLTEQGTIGPLTSLKSAVVGAEPLSESQRNYIRKLAMESGESWAETIGLRARTNAPWSGTPDGLCRKLRRTLRGRVVVCCLGGSDWSYQ